MPTRPTTVTFASSTKAAKITYIRLNGLLPLPYRDVSRARFYVDRRSFSPHSFAVEWTRCAPLTAIIEEISHE